MMGCVSPNAANVEALTLGLDKLNKVAENLSIQVTKIVQAETINYGGAPWVIVGMSVVILIFLFAIYFVGKSLLKHKNMLHLVTCAVKKSSPEIRVGIKKQIEDEVIFDGFNGTFKKQHKQDLAEFTIKKGTFAK